MAALDNTSKNNEPSFVVQDIDRQNPPGLNVTLNGLIDQQQCTNAYDKDPKTDATYILVSFRSPVASGLPYLAFRG